MANGNGAGNGSNKILWWILGFVIPTAISALTGTIHTIQATSARVSVLETHMADQDARLHRIEEKLDRLIDRATKPGTP